MAIIATQQEHNIVSFLSAYLSLSERRLENMSTRRTPFHGRRRTDRYSDLRSPENRFQKRQRKRQV